MKRVLIGGFLSLNGTIWCLAIILYCTMNLATEWNTPPGRFFTTAIQSGMMVPLLAAVLLLAAGLCMMGVEYFRKNN